MRFSVQPIALSTDCILECIAALGLLVVHAMNVKQCWQNFLWVLLSSSFLFTVSSDYHKTCILIVCHNNKSSSGFKQRYKLKSIELTRSLARHVFPLLEWASSSIRDFLVTTKMYLSLLHPWSYLCHASHYCTS